MKGSCTRIVIASVALIVMIVVISVFTGKVRKERFQDGNNRKARLIYVYMDGCGHCRAFDPVWTSFTRTYRKALQEAGVEPVRLRNDDRAADALSVHGYPTVVLISDLGDFSQTTFEGQRTGPGLASFVENSFPAFTS